MKIVYKGASAEITEKKSRFIATVSPAATEQEAADYIAETKKRFWDCKHNCSAFVVGGNPVITRCSDDGEPSGTAGRPILDVITGADVTNVCVVVSRYFGGVLLGTGGLVRAYSAAAKKALEASVISELFTGVELTCSLGYDYVGKLQYLASEEKLPLLSDSYADKVKMTFMVPVEKYSFIENKITELSSGRIGLNSKDPVKYIIVDEKVIIL